MTARGLVRSNIPSDTRKVPEFHAHGCLGCGRRYTDACHTPLHNSRCKTCTLGVPAPLWDLSRAPQACCKTDSVLIKDSATLVRYALGGSSPWWKCRTCSRTHPSNPKETP